MKTATPIKNKIEEPKGNRKDNRSPNRPVTIKKKLGNQDFNPSLYTNSKFDEELVLLIKEAFDSYDSNKTGLLTPNDLKNALFHQNFHATKQTVYNIIAEYDEECIGGLNFEAFMKIISSQPRELQSLEDMKKVFRKLDKENKGFLEKKDLQVLIKSLGEAFDQNEVEILIDKLDTKGTRKINFDDFCKIMHHHKSIY